MIPIIVGPQGPGYTNIYIDSDNNFVQITTPPITGINIGKLNCYIGPTGILGKMDKQIIILVQVRQCKLQVRQVYHLMQCCIIQMTVNFDSFIITIHLEIVIH